VRSPRNLGPVMPRDFLEGIGRYLHHFAPDREDELMAAIKGRAEELADADQDMVVDEASKAFRSSRP
jgi:hypothetical protein